MASSDHNGWEPNLEMEVVESSGLLSELRRRYPGAKHHDASPVNQIPVNSAGQDDGSAVDFAGILAMCSGRVVAALGYAEEPDRTMSVTLPLFGKRFSHAVQRKAIELLVRYLQKKSEYLNLRGVHCLLPVTSSVDADRRLIGWFADANVNVVARIGGMLLQVCSTTMHSQTSADTASDGFAGALSVDSIAMADQPVIGVQRYRLSENYYARLMQSETLSDATGSKGCSDLPCSPVRASEESPVDVEATAVRLLIHQILKSSDDLPAECRPEVDDMLRMWTARGCLVLVVWPADDSVAASCSQNDPAMRDLDSDALAANPVAVVSLSLAELVTVNDPETQSAGCCVPSDAAALAIEYLGVRSDRRRLGIASLLLDFICSHASQLSDRLRENQLTGGRQTDRQPAPAEQKGFAFQVAQLSAYVDVNNSAAVNFYHRKGFKLVRQFDLLFRRTESRSGSAAALQVADGDD